jgi:hypothetical protein
MLARGAENRGPRIKEASLRVVTVSIENKPITAVFARAEVRAAT